MSILITRAHVRDPNDYAELHRAFGEDVAYWPAHEILPGASTLLLSAPLDLFVLDGEFTLTLDGIDSKIAAGDRVRLPGGVSVGCRASARASFRARALEVETIDAALVSIADRMAKSSPPSGFGFFQRIGSADDLPEGAILLSASARAASTRLLPVGALGRALFSLTRTELVLRTLYLRDEAAARIEFAFLWQPGGLKFSESDAVPQALVTRLHALDVPALRHVGPHCRFTSVSVPPLERIELSLRLDRCYQLERPDELFVSHDGSLHRWIDTGAGTPVDVAVRELVGSRAPVAPARPANEADAFLEQLFSTLWTLDRRLIRYMHQPETVPYPIRFLTLHAPFRPSPAFCARWQIAAICAGRQASFTPEAFVEVVFEDPSGATSGSEFTVRWRYFQELAFWKYQQRTHGGKRVLEREIIDQYD